MKDKRCCEGKERTKRLENKSVKRREEGKKESRIKRKKQDKRNSKIREMELKDMVLYIYRKAITMINLVILILPFTLSMPFHIVIFYRPT